MQLVCVSCIIIDHQKHDIVFASAYASTVKEMPVVRQFPTSFVGWKDYVTSFYEKYGDHHIASKFEIAFSNLESHFMSIRSIVDSRETDLKGS
jgi:hypothetical protein